MDRPFSLVSVGYLYPNDLQRAGPSWRIVNELDRLEAKAVSYE